MCLERGQVNKWPLLLKDKGLTHTHTQSALPYPRAASPQGIIIELYALVKPTMTPLPPPLPGIGCLPTYIGGLRCLINPHITRACVVLGTTCIP